MGKGPQESIHRKTVFKHTTVCSTSFMTREMHKKAAMIFPFSAGKLVKIKRLITHYQKREEKGIHCHGSVMCTVSLEGGLVVLNQIYKEAYSLIQKFLYLNLHGCKFKDSPSGC